MFDSTSFLKKKCNIIIELLHEIFKTHHSWEEKMVHNHIKKEKNNHLVSKFKTKRNQIKHLCIVVISKYSLLQRLFQLPLV